MIVEETKGSGRFATQIFLLLVIILVLVDSAFFFARRILSRPG
jgi:hypothetical protein